MTTHRQVVGARKHVRVELHKTAFLIPAPSAPWIECSVVDVSEMGVCLNVGALAVPDIFGLSFTAGGEVLRVCSLAWRRGELIGARFVSAKELRQGLLPIKTPEPAMAPNSALGINLVERPAVQPQQLVNFNEIE